MTLFGHVTVTCQALRQNISVSFYSFRKHLFRIFQHPPLKETGKNITLVTIIIIITWLDSLQASFRFCTEFLHFVDVQVAHLCVVSTNPHLQISLFDDVISHLTSTIQALVCDELEGEGLPLHISLHLYWTRLALLYRILVTVGKEMSL